ncbi:cysteine-rich venom protein [Gouania willdenowi]|uniref:cysteine-rich venom protein n=1 Tax=Gouania willdenowi TaxID=441366 RepID=UPI0010560D12|nr:cysteine-rich venom protein-like [Gouania willdenowi]
MGAERCKRFLLLLGMMVSAQHGVHSVCTLPGVCTEDTVVQDEIVDLHNNFRRGVQPSASNMLLMSYSVDLALTAQLYVDQCVLAHGDPSTRMLDGYELGENLFYSSELFSWTEVINAWYNEVENYQYPNVSTNGKHIGHYTQVVWNTSYRVGCGVTLCPDNIYLYGCHYYRAGNFIGIPPYTVGSLCGACPDHCVENLCTNPCQYIDSSRHCPEKKEEGRCSDPLVAEECPASCGCLTEIIPIS